MCSSLPLPVIGGVTEEFISLISSINVNSRSRFCVCGDVSPELLLLPLLSNVVVQVAMKNALSSCEDSGTNIYSKSNLCDLEFADDFVLLNEYSSKLDYLLDGLNDSADIFCTSFVSSTDKFVFRLTEEASDNKDRGIRTVAVVSNVS